MTQWSPSFEVDRDAVRSVQRNVTVAALAGSTATFTTSVAHGFAPGWQVTIDGLGEPYDGTFTLVATPTTTTFTVNINSTDIPSAAVTGTATSPSNAYLRHSSLDPSLDDIASQVSLHVETWDYNTVRVVWGLNEAIEEIALNDISEHSLEPRICVTRSGFGYPVTPLDGEKIFDKPYIETVANVGRTDVLPYFETQPANTTNSFNRPPPPVQSLYDRNLPSGRWYYYSVFFYLQGSEAEQRWRLGLSGKALTPVDYNHGDKLYELLPNYYQSKDQEFTPGTGMAGTLERLLQVIGFDLDYTKTLADGIEHTYDVDSVNEDLLEALGVGSFGVPVEGGLGGIRYRSLIGAVSRLYDERGSTSCLQKMTLASTKYRNKIIEGINMMCLTDDAEFASGTGSWGNLAPADNTFLGTESWMGGTLTVINASDLAISETPILTTPTGASPGSSLVTRRTAMLVTPSGGSGGALISCGVGTGEVTGRRHESVPATFYPRLHGIKCDIGTIYTFSAYARKNTGTTGNISVGIMWFNEVENGEYDIDNDFISKSESFPAGESTATTMSRHFVDSEAPLSLRGQEYVFAVPYIAWTTRATRWVSACMFNSQLNSAASFALSTDHLLTLGVPTEYLGSDYLLGDS